ncbi:hypothetical protein COCON_G00057020 [Conger conger]|uniref:Uncharacterized protein n=1 Tax=Conger conger TaxID=82655 RepID=A0A9Q1DQJ3_CONCO|nr:hypothetical protein COCON_G00057020 [Conger conger]
MTDVLGKLLLRSDRREGMPSADLAARRRPSVSEGAESWGEESDGDGSAEDEDEDGGGRCRVRAGAMSLVRKRESAAAQSMTESAAHFHTFILERKRPCLCSAGGVMVCKTFLQIRKR